MHISVRGIVEEETGIVLIHRVKEREDGTIRDYYVVPGGKEEKGENNLQTLERELKEELGIGITVKEKLIEYHSDYDDTIQIFYFCTRKDGKIGTGEGPEMTDKEHYKGLFEPTIIDYGKVKDINLVPEEIKSLLIKRYQKN